VIGGGSGDVTGVTDHALPGGVFNLSADANTKFRDGKIAYYRGTEDTAQTQAELQA
jgi:hypothetical protein